MLIGNVASRSHKTAKVRWILGFTVASKTRNECIKQAAEVIEVSGKSRRIDCSGFDMFARRDDNMEAEGDIRGKRGGQSWRRRLSRRRSSGKKN